MIIHLKVKPNSAKNEFRRDDSGEIVIRLKAPPVDGKANEMLISFLSDFFSVSKSRIHILTGHSSKYKKIEIEGEYTELEKKLSLIK